MSEWPAKLDISALTASGWRPTPFREFVFKIHSRCNLSCEYCYIYKMADQSWRSQPKRVSRKTVDYFTHRLSSHVRENSLPSVRVVLHGGEPLLAGEETIEYIVGTLRTSVEARVDISLQTNGMLLDPAYLKLFDQLDVHVGVSLDGDKDAHDRHRRQANGRKSYASVIRGIEYLASPLQALVRWPSVYHRPMQRSS